MNLNLDGKVAVVTGASKGIGLAATKALVNEGAYVIAGARKTESLAGIERVTAVDIDLTAPSAPAELVQRAITEHSRIDVLINNVGAAHLRLDGFLGVSDADFAASMEMNFFIALRSIRAALGPMLSQGGGSIVSVASVNAFFEPDAGVVDYGAAKAALLNVHKSLSQEFASKGIRFNSVSPGPVSTELWLGEKGIAATVANASGVDAESARKTIVAGMGGIPSGRFTTPEEVATLLVLLASDRTANVNGSNFVIDGGLIKTT